MRIAFISVIAFALGGSSPAMAGPLLNGDFEGGAFAPGWTLYGEGGVETGPLPAPPQGLFQGFIRTRDGSSRLAADLEADLGLTAGTLNSVNGGSQDAFEGSAIRSGDFTALAGESLLFQWNFLTSETGVDPADDFAFYVLYDSVGNVLDVDSLATVFGGPGLGGGPAIVQEFFNASTGFLSGSIGLPGPGTYSVAFGVVDDADAGVTSGLLLDSVVTAAVAPVPEPSSLALVGLGLAGLAARRRRARLSAPSQVR